jgi:hypothetical protein
VQRDARWSCDEWGIAEDLLHLCRGALGGRVVGLTVSVTPLTLFHPTFLFELSSELGPYQPISVQTSNKKCVLRCKMSPYRQKAWSNRRRLKASANTAKLKFFAFFELKKADSLKAFRLGPSGKFRLNFVLNFSVLNCFHCFQTFHSSRVAGIGVIHYTASSHALMTPDGLGNLS